ncbi:hypothetical protein [Vibrio sp. MA40-2]|uniref:hypothetical protein n=1 Tax=Vibrio sp. MA40-2 TaxID=3391828 RepID=UPI0039A76918
MIKLVKIINIIILIQLVILSKSQACDFYYTSEMLKNSASSSSLCDLLSKNNDLGLETDYYFSNNELDQKNQDYWSSWAIETEDSPFVTGQVQDNFIGLGVWMPSALSDIENEMEYKDWLLNHGLQFSVGFGEQNGEAPRMRFDYRWHRNQAADVMFQVELPF